MATIYEEKLSPEHYEYADTVLGETKEIRHKCLAEINEWLDQNPHINAFRDPRNLLHFLRGSKFRMDKAKKRIET